MKPLLILLALILTMAACNTGSNTNAAKAVCSKVVADCCITVTTSVGDYKCQVKRRSLGDDLFSVSMHEITKEMFTW